MASKLRAKAALTVSVLAVTGCGISTTAWSAEPPQEATETNGSRTDWLPEPTDDLDDLTLPVHLPAEVAQMEAEISPSLVERGLVDGDEPNDLDNRNGTGTFRVSGDLVGTFDTLTQALDAVNDDPGSDYTLTLTADFNADDAVPVIPSGKRVTLTSEEGSDFTIFSPSARHLSVTGELTLENITLDGVNTAGGIDVIRGVLTVGPGTSIQNCWGAIGGAISARLDSTVSITGGEIRDNTARTTFFGIGGGVYLLGSDLEMSGGVISGNDAFHGGGVYAAKGSTFDFDGGEIRANTVTTSDGSGGGVYIYASSTLTMNGGVIADNVAKTFGGGIYAAIASQVQGDPTTAANVFIHGGQIEGNTAEYGAGVAAQYVGHVNMDGGVIRGNTASYGGGGIVALGSYFEDHGVDLAVTGGEISGNSAEVLGGGIWLRGSFYGRITATIGTLGSDSGPLISENRSQYGGGVAVYSNDDAGLADLVMNSGTIGANFAERYGGGLALIGGIDAALEGGLIGGLGAANVAKYGGGIATVRLDNVDSANILDVSGTNIADNSASVESDQDDDELAGDGGGIYLSSSDRMRLKSAVTGNSARNDGGGIYVSQTATLETIGGAQITDNEAGNEGGGIYTADFDTYEDLTLADYQNLTTSDQTVFADNRTPLGYLPPEIAADYLNIGYASTSSGPSGSYSNPLNNLDINYVGSTPDVGVSINYHANGGSGAFTSSSSSGSSYQVLSPAETGITWAGHSFVGWNTASDGSGQDWQPGSTMVVDGDVDLYAQWVTEGEPGPSGPTGPTGPTGTDPDVPPVPEVNDLSRTGIDAGILILAGGLLVTGLLLTARSINKRRFS